MAIPFTEGTNHRIYKNTTLQNVVITFCLNPQGPDYYNASFYERLDKFTTDKFSLKVDHTLPDKPFQIHNSKLHSTFIFANGMVVTVLPREGYVSFQDTAMPQIRRMREYVQEVLSEDSVKRIYLRKLNVWQLVDVKGDPNDVLDKLKPVLFSKALLSDTNHVAYDEAEQKVLFGKLGWEDGNEQLTIRTAFVPVKDQKASFNIVLDIEVLISETEGVALDGLSSKILEWNQHLFNAFQWSLNETVIKRMEG